MALPSLPLLTSPNSTNLFHTATNLHTCQPPTETRPGRAGRRSALYFWGRGLPQITYGGDGPFQSPTPAQKYIRRGKPSQTPTPPPPKNTYGWGSLPTHSHYPILKAALAIASSNPYPTHRPSERRHDTILNKHRVHSTCRMLFNIHITLKKHPLPYQSPRQHHIKNHPLPIPTAAPSYYLPYQSPRRHNINSIPYPLSILTAKHY